MDLYNYDWEYQQYWSLKQYPPRPEQKKIINEIIEAIEMGFRNIIVEAGTGTGKSAIATTIARYIGDSYILTMTKQLQNQYLDDFDYMLAEIKGKSNYNCQRTDATCDDCYVNEFNDDNKLVDGANVKIPHCPTCPYRVALKEAINSPAMLTNYDYLYMAGNYAELFEPRDLLILDESHNLEKKIMTFIGKTLNRQVIFKRYGIDIFYPITKGSTLKSIDNSDYWVGVLHRLTEIAINHKAIEPTRKGHELYDKDIQKFNYLISKLEDNEAKFIIELPTKTDILKDKLTDGRFHNGLKAEFKPLMIKDYSDSLLQFGETRLFMTGTLGNKDSFCKWIGIDPKETYYIYVKSPFPVSNRPIIKSYVGSMSNNRWKNQAAIDKIKTIMNKHKGEKGVIHTSSNQQAWWIKKALDSNKVWVAYGATREDTIRRFEASRKPIVLVGAGIKDGVDFKHDKCRYQIIFKMPYPSLAGKQVNIRMHYDESWYNYQTIMPLMQAYGRGIRDSTDYCTCYILDNDFEKLLRKYKYLFNEYFLEAIKTVKPRQVPRPIKVNGGK